MTLWYSEATSRHIQYNAFLVGTVCEQKKKQQNHTVKLIEVLLHRTQPQFIAFHFPLLVTQHVLAYLQAIFRRDL
jgi:hypothetical protein